MDARTDSELTDKVVNALYTEAMLLADEARSYFDAFGHRDRTAMDPLDRVTFSCESRKVTTRLMHIVAWLLARRALLAGNEATAHPLAAAAPSEGPSLAKLPEDARIVIAASMDLYARIERLDARLGQDVPEDSPALMLRARLERAF